MKWFEIGATSHFGYPQPEDSYAEVVYDAAGSCPTCGIKGHQRSPFRFRSEPKSNRCQFIQLNWVFDEIFIRPEVRSIFETEKVSGISFGPALHNRSSAPLMGLEQLKVEMTLRPGLTNEMISVVTCKENNEESRLPITQDVGGPYCGRTKYHYPKNGLSLSRLALADAPDFVKTNEWFGSGGRAFRVMIISEKVAAIIKRESWRGVHLKELRVE